MGNSDNVIGYIEYLSDDGKIVGYVTPFTDVDKFRKEILKAAEVGMPITPVVFPDKLDKSLGLPRDIYWPGGFRKEKRHTYVMPPDYMGDAVTITMDAVAAATAPEITEEMYEQLDYLEKHPEENYYENEENFSQYDQGD